MATEADENPYAVQDPAEDGERILDEAVEANTATEGEQAAGGDHDDDADDSSGSVETGGDEPTGETVDDDAHGEEDAGEAQEMPYALVREAEQLGFSKEEIQGFGDPQRLEQVLVAFNRQLAARGRPAEEGAEQQPAQQPKAEPAKLELPEINLEEVDPEIAKYITGQTKVIQELYGQVQGLSSLQQQVQALHAQEQQRQAEAFQSQFDGFIDGLGDAWDDVFGKKAGDLAEKSRQNLMEEAFVLASGYEATGRQMPTAEELLSRALRSTHGDRFQNLARKELNVKLRQRSRQGIARPSNRKAADMSPTERATRAVADQMAAKGWGLDDGGTAEQFTI